MKKYILQKDGELLGGLATEAMVKGRKHKLSQYTEVVIPLPPTIEETQYIDEGPVELINGVPMLTYLVKDYTDEEFKTIKSKEVIKKRDELLTASDKEWLRVSESAQIEGRNQSTCAECQAWHTYRQALRDIPDQVGFPITVEWPSL